MRAVVLGQPGGPESLMLSALPLPRPSPGWVRIQVRAFGLNRSALHTRLGLSKGVTFPRVLGIEAVGVIDELPDGDEPERAAALRAHGVDHVIVDGGQVAAAVRAIVPAGVDAALELIGTATLPDTLRATRVHGTVCFTGMLSNRWTVDEFYPIDYIPRGVRLTAYAGGAGDLPAAVLQDYLDRLAASSLSIGPMHTYVLDAMPRAHADLAHNRVFGKLVGVIDPADAANSNRR